MASLHLINKPGEPFRLCQRVLVKGDAVLLLEDGIYLLVASINIMAEMAAIYDIYCIDADQKARGVSHNVSAIKSIDYMYFVKLTCQYKRTLSWF